MLLREKENENNENLKRNSMDVTDYRVMEVGLGKRDDIGLDFR